MPASLTEFIRLHTFDDNADVRLAVVLLAIVGLIVGRFLAGWVRRMAEQGPVVPRSPCPQCGRNSTFIERIPFLGSFFLGRGCSTCKVPRGEVLLMELATAALYVIVFLGIAQIRTQEVVEGGQLAWYPFRIFSQLVLVTLMLAATGIDFKRYLIPDAITIPGMIFGVVAATWAGNIQILPLWVDWNDAVPGLRGGYIPDWIKHHDHLHGFAWSMAGLLTGAAITWIARIVSRILLGQESLGLGDVTLMAMIGSFLGWQPVIFAFSLAPMWGIIFAFLLWLITGKTFVPYGPYLCAGALTVMLSWRWLWPPVRLIFGHPPTIALIGGGVLLGFVVLLSLLRLYRSFPVQSQGR